MSVPSFGITAMWFLCTVTQLDSILTGHPRVPSAHPPPSVGKHDDLVNDSYGFLRSAQPHSPVDALGYYACMRSHPPSLLVPCIYCRHDLVGRWDSPWCLHSGQSEASRACWLTLGGVEEQLHDWTWKQWRRRILEIRLAHSWMEDQVWKYVSALTFTTLQADY